MASERLVKGKKTPYWEQIKVLRKVLDSGLVSDYSVAIDGGANVGDWSLILAERFERVLAFEPILDTYADLRSRLRERAPNVEVYQQALFDKDGLALTAQIDPKKSLKANRSWYVQPIEDEASLIRSVTIDSLKLPNLGLLKLDIEGAEYKALIGAKDTIRKHRPVIIVEVETRHGLRFRSTPTDIYRFMQGVQYERLRAYDSPPDQVWVPVKRG